MRRLSVVILAGLMAAFVSAQAVAEKATSSEKTVVKTKKDGTVVTTTTTKTNDGEGNKTRTTTTSTSSGGSGGDSKEGE
jgi:hypothetical protein